MIPNGGARLESEVPVRAQKALHRGALVLYRFHNLLCRIELHLSMELKSREQPLNLHQVLPSLEINTGETSSYRAVKDSISTGGAGGNRGPKLVKSW